MSINVKKGQRVTCKQSVVLSSKATSLSFTCGREYIASGNNWIKDNYLCEHNCSDSRWFNDHFTLIPFIPVIKKKTYTLSYEFAGVYHSTPYNTLFEFAQALDKVMDLAEVPQDTIDFKTETR